MATWYHGTTTEHGNRRAGDYADPRRCGFEPAFWVTSDPSLAKGYAKAACAAHGGEPEVWEMRLPENAVVVSDVDPTTPREYEEIRDHGADAILFAVGEGGAPMMAILTRCATFRSTVDVAVSKAAG
jgi:hypothetical protein